MTHQVAFRDDYIENINGIARFFSNYKDRKYADAYMIEINDVAGFREYGLTPTRVRIMNERMKVAAILMDMKLIKALTDSRWEASRDGLHFFWKLQDWRREWMWGCC